jgi:hypothetical protein
MVGPHRDRDVRFEAVIQSTVASRRVYAFVDGRDG